MKAFTDLDQSKKLAKILPAESADMCYIQNSPGGKYELCLGDITLSPGQSKIPAWSLGALIDALPRINYFKPIIELEDCSIVYKYETGLPEDLWVKSNNLVNACYKMIVKLHEENYKFDE